MWSGILLIVALSFILGIYAVVSLRQIALGKWNEYHVMEYQHVKSRLALVCLAIIVLFAIIASAVHSMYRPIGETYGNGVSTDLFGGPCRWNPSWNRALCDSFSGATSYAEEAKQVAEAMRPRLDYNLRNKQSLIDIWRDAVIVHFRCGDSPFDRAPTALLPKKSFFRLIRTQMERMERAHIKRVVLMSCTKHQCKDCTEKTKAMDYQRWQVERIYRARRCGDWARVQISWLHELFSNTSVAVEYNSECMDELSTIAAFVGSIMLFSTGGSFAFMPGITKGKSFYSQPFDKRICSFTVNLTKTVHWSISPWSSFIPHETIRSYLKLSAIEYDRLAE